MTQDIAPLFTEPRAEELQALFRAFTTRLSDEQQIATRADITRRAEQRFKSLHGATWKDTQEKIKRERQTAQRYANLLQRYEQPGFLGHAVPNSKAQDEARLKDLQDDYNDIEVAATFEHALETNIVDASQYPFLEDENFYKVLPDAPEKLTDALGTSAAPLAPMTVVTFPICSHMYRHLSSTDATTRNELTITHNSKRRKMSATSTIDLPDARNDENTFHDYDGVLQGIGRHRATSALLLKLHLDLMNCAYQKEGAFVYDINASLARLGYEPVSGKSFHTKTKRSHYARLITLACQWVSILKVNEPKDPVFVSKTPYWTVDSLMDGQGLPDLPSVFALSAPVPTKVWITPGAWWDPAKMKRYYLQLPAQLLTLPVDGNGHAVNRMALQLAAALAVWVRSSHNQHAGKEVPYGVGTLLEASGITTYKAFLAQSATERKRLRRNLAGENYDEGAFKVLRDHQAFQIDIKDDDAFGSAESGWEDKFWEARVKVQIPRLL